MLCSDFDASRRPLVLTRGLLCVCVIVGAVVMTAFDRPSDVELKQILTAEQYRVTQHDGTEKPFKNSYWDNKEPGLYVDIVSGEVLFSSNDKYNSGTGWPSFVRPISDDAIIKKPDRSFFRNRTEVRSKLADSHLGHVFNDGPATRGGLRYCINSAALRFIHKDDLAAEGYTEYVFMFD